MSTDLVIPTASDLEALTPAERWAIEDKLDEAQDILREFNDDELRKWIESGKTQREVAEIVGRSKSDIGRRCARLGIHSGDARGGDRTLPQVGQTIEADLDEPAPRTTAREVASTPEPPVGSADSPYTHCPTCGHKLRKDQPLRRTA